MDVFIIHSSYISNWSVLNTASIMQWINAEYNKHNSYCIIFFMLLTLVCHRRIAISLLCCVWLSRRICYLCVMVVCAIVIWLAVNQLQIAVMQNPVLNPVLSYDCRMRLDYRTRLWCDFPSKQLCEEVSVLRTIVFPITFVYGYSSETILVSRGG